MKRLVCTAPVLLPATLLSLVTACSSDDGTTEAHQDWNAVDVCSLVDRGQVAKLDYSESGDQVAEPTPSNSGGPVCEWDDYLRISIVGEAEMSDPGAPTRAVDYPVPANPIRTFSLHDREVLITREIGGDCSAFVRYRDANLVIAIDVARSKTDIDVDDTSAASCDAQKPLIDSILSRVKLP
ncbi:hypothetical protein FEK35_21640 [Nocardia cyriacigeorgica]|uniref:DUF3558 domain-containing protein n=2 Tax=Nocardia cyriacigeorgica TaxID=135487 RepID=A0A5R8PA35_9NOCA|nr:hypothetical protein FEK35_21640 [Nocardia cyriacigeorgica]